MWSEVALFLFVLFTIFLRRDLTETKNLKYHSQNCCYMNEDSEENEFPDFPKILNHLSRFSRLKIWPPCWWGNGSAVFTRIAPRIPPYTLFASKRNECRILQSMDEGENGGFLISPV